MNEYRTMLTTLAENVMKRADIQMTRAEHEIAQGNGAKRFTIPTCNRYGRGQTYARAIRYQSKRTRHC